MHHILILRKYAALDNPSPKLETAYIRKKPRQNHSQDKKVSIKQIIPDRIPYNHACNTIVHNCSHMSLDLYLTMSITMTLQNGSINRLMPLHRGSINN